MKKRMLMMLLALVMIVSVLPFAAMAAETECDHSANDYRLESKPATCIHEGAINYICNECGKLAKSQPVPGGFAPHAYDKNSKCAVCGVVCKKHTYGPKTTILATCTKSGSETKICTKCGYKNVTELPKTGHNFKDPVNGRVATCTVDGYSAHKKCTKCDAVNSDYVVIPATGHDYETLKDTVATCTKNGTLKQECKVCGYVNEETRKRTGHSYTEIPAEGPTCTEEGHSAYKKCSKCNKVTGKTTIAATGHTYVNGQCVDCGAAAPNYSAPSKPIKKCKHPSKSTYTTSPDCTVVGYVVVTCDTCHVEISREIIPATGHTLKSVKQDPTCTEDGFVMEICEVCNTPISGIAMEALGHNHVNGICTRCGGADPQKYTNDLQDVFLVG